MHYEIKRIEPLRLANVLALVYGVATLIVAILVAALHALMPMHGMGGRFAEPGLMRVVVVVYPILALAWGWVGGLAGAAIYNAVAGWVGGIALHLAGPPAPSPEAPAGRPAT